LFGKDDIEGHAEPKPQEKYSEKQHKEWKELWQIYKSCAVFEQTERPNIEDVVERLHVVNSPSLVHTESNSGELSECALHLKVSQSSFFEKCCEITTNQIQAGLVLNETEINQLHSYIALGDATNSCTFLCLTPSLLDSYTLGDQRPCWIFNQFLVSAQKWTFLCRYI
jgi:hypothetical protein